MKGNKYSLKAPLINLLSVYHSINYFLIVRIMTKLQNKYVFKLHLWNNLLYQVIHSQINWFLIKRSFRSQLLMIKTTAYFKIQESRF